MGENVWFLNNYNVKNSTQQVNVLHCVTRCIKQGYDEQ